MKSLEVINNTRAIFESVGKNDAYFETWQREIHPILCEVALNPDQIKQLFANAEAGSRTALGKGIDVAKVAAAKISDVWFNKFGGMLQSSKPIKDFDARWEKIKSDIAAKNPNLAATLAKYGEFAKKNPNLHKFLLAIAASIASSLGVAVVGGVGAGALAVGSGVGVATGIINIADRLLQGQAASTAIGRGATAGLVAGLTAASIRAAVDLVKGIDVVTTIRGSWKITYDAVPGGHYQFFLKKEDYEKFLAAQKAIQSTVAKIDFMSNSEAYFAAARKADAENLQLVRKFFAMASTPEYQEAAMKAAKITIEPNVIEKAVGAVSKMAKAWNPVISAIVGTGAIGNGQKSTTTPPPAPPAPPSPPPRESKQYKKSRQIFESIEKNNYDLYLRQQFAIMMEADGDKKPGFLSRLGKKFTTKVTADQIEKSWEKAGSPTDSEDIAKLLLDIGVNKEVISKTYADLSLPAPAAIPADSRAEPSLSDTPTAPPTPSETPPTPAGDTAPPTPSETPPTPAAGEIFKNPQSLLDEFDAWLNAGNKITPALRGAIKKAMIDVGFVTVENKKAKLKNIIKEANRIEKELKNIQRQKHETI